MERIQKLLAHSGLGSRRKVEELVRLGHISVNGTQATLGQKISGTEEIRVQGKILEVILPKTQGSRLLIMNKQIGWICSHSKQTDHPRVYDLLPKIRRGRWVSVGRLDVNSSGLLLFTNNGELANFLMHPNRSFKRVYKVRAFGQLTGQQLNKLTSGVMIDGKLCKFNQLTQLSAKHANVWYEVTILSGQNRVVRKLFESQGCKVNKLVRLRHGPFILPSLLPALGVTEIPEVSWRKKIPEFAKNKNSKS